MHEGDAIEWLKSHCATNAPPLDLIFVDAFDGNNNVPNAFTDAGRIFNQSLQVAMLYGVSSQTCKSTWNIIALLKSGAEMSWQLAVVLICLLSMQPADFQGLLRKRYRHRKTEVPTPFSCTCNDNFPMRASPLCCRSIMELAWLLQEILA